LESVVTTLENLAGQPSWLCWADLPSLLPPWNVADVFTRPYLQSESTEDDEADEPFEPLPDPAIGPIDRDDLELWERMRCTYAGAVAYLDAGLGLLFDEMKKNDTYDTCTIIFTSDRGLALGEHGIVGDCQPWLHDEVVHIPLIVRQPQGADAGRRIFGLTQPLDLTSTLLEMFGVPAADSDGRSWLPLLDGKVDAIRENCLSTWKMGDAEEWAIRTLDHALLVPVMQPVDTAVPRVVQLYRKPEDRWEVNNVIQHELELAEQLERILRAAYGKP